MPVRPACFWAASTASRSTRSFIRSSLWPFTQVNRTRWGSDRYASISGSHRSRLATGFFALLSQPRASQPSHHRSRKQFTTYVESLTTSSGPSMLRNASRAALTSIRWLVERASGPLAKGPSRTAQAHPPGPGFPRQAPSV